ncbi:PREDICTED: OTU domain-containing protein 7A-like [Nipponia nippon]|uniref:OTU domain-containing protein 7A-like n=1 Tax=Nipponia nippon TaxID=128390 RepID=UPI000510D82F|nr:PREDICTED: OTU domain-containing protein 7A-like [Nipponia nippon]
MPLGGWACDAPADPELTGEASRGRPRALAQRRKNTCMVGKGKNQADAAAGERPAQAGPGKRRSARGQVGGPTAPPRQGGAGEGNPAEGCPSSASSAEARSPAGGRTELASATWSCHESSGEEAAPGCSGPTRGLPRGRPRAPSPGRGTPSPSRLSLARRERSAFGGERCVPA